MASGLMNLKPSLLLLNLIWLPAWTVATEKTVYGLNEYVLVADIEVEVAAKLDTGAKNA